MPPKRNKAQLEGVGLIMTPGKNAIGLQGDGDKSLLDFLATFKSLEKRLAPKSVPKWCRAMCECLQGVLHERPSQIEEGIATMLAFYTLCHLVNPDLVAEIDVERKLPWDAELHTFVFGKAEPFELNLDLRFVSQAFHDAMIGLEKPAWWGRGPMVASVPPKR